MRTEQEGSRTGARRSILERDARCVTPPHGGLIRNCHHRNLRALCLARGVGSRYICVGLMLGTPVLHKDLTQQVINAAKTVHAELGPGLPHKFYRDALELELRELGLSAEC